jgi:hypothetical protein
MQDRDRSIEKLLRETRAAAPVSPVDCPDAETLAAMADDTLPARMLREIEAHVAGCHRCQDLTAAMVRADMAAATAAAAAGERRRWLNWLVPAAAAATAVALWVLVPGQQGPTPTAPTADTQVAATPPALPPLTPEVIVSEPLRIPGEAREESAAAAPPPPAAAAPPPPPAAPAEAAPQGEASAVGRLQAPAAERRDQAALNETVALQDRAAPAQARRAASVEVVSPDPRVRWRVGPGLIVQRSTDGGASWIAQQTGASAELTAGSAPTVDVCWLVGRGGVVLRTTDGGGQWQRVMFPEAADLAAISATTARNATVTLADGRRFTTTDGGAVWIVVR